MGILDSIEWNNHPVLGKEHKIDETLMLSWAAKDEHLWHSDSIVQSNPEPRTPHFLPQFAIRDSRFEIRDPNLAFSASPFHQSATCLDPISLAYSRVCTHHDL